MWYVQLSELPLLSHFAKKPHTTAPSASPRCRFTAEELYFNGENHLTTREFYDVALIFFYCFFYFFSSDSHIILGFLRHQTVKLTPDGEMSFKQLRASLLLLPATTDSFLQVHMGEAGDSKTMLNLVFSSATSMGFSILTAPKICHNHSICLECRMTGSCLQQMKNRQTKDDSTQRRNRMYLHGSLYRSLFIRCYELLYL